MEVRYMVSRRRLLLTLYLIQGIAFETILTLYIILVTPQPTRTAYDSSESSRLLGFEQKV